MKIKNHSKQFNFFYYLLLTFVVTGLFHLITGFFSLNFRVPAADHGSDYLPIFYQFKSLLEGDWFPFTGIHSERLGFPFGSNWNDYPMNHSLFYLIIKCLGIFSSDWPTVFNIYWLMTFILNSLTFAYAARKLNLKSEVAFLLSILFSFMPFHFLRMGHIWLSSYFLVPLQIVVLHNIWDAHPVFFNKLSKNKSSKSKNKKIFTWIVLLLSGWAGVYYLFFFCAIAGFAMISVWIQKKSIKHVLSVIALIGICILSATLDSIPTIVKNIKEGGNSSGFQRTFAESESYGLKLIQLYLPAPSHRNPKFALKALQYNTIAPLVTENNTTSLGIIGAIGFSLLILMAFFESRIKVFLRNLYKLNLAAVLIGTIGGFGAVFAFFISPSIRGYNRISIFIFGFSLLCIGYLLTKLRKKIQRYIYIILIFVITLIGIWDQTSNQFKFSQPVENFKADQDFFSKLESIAGDSAIYQLPVVDFPDIISYSKMGEYEQLRGYLYTQKTKWSYGNIFGRYPNAWLQNRSFTNSTSTFLSEIQSVGFRYIYLNKDGYIDSGKEMMARLESNLGRPILESLNGKYVIYDLTHFNSTISDLNPKELLETPVFAYGAGIIFSQSPIIGTVAQYPAYPVPILLFNPKKNPIKVQISFSVDNIPVADKTALINFRGSMYTVKMDSNPWTYTKELELPNGVSKFLISFPNYLSITMRDFKISKIN